jgi:hypothetical protein
MSDQQYMAGLGSLLEPETEALAAANKQIASLLITQDTLVHIIETCSAKLKARIALLEAKINNGKHELEKCRMWNGSGYDWHPIHAKRAWEALQEEDAKESEFQAGLRSVEYGLKREQEDKP